jgi:putative transcriptional regulator
MADKDTEFGAELIEALKEVRAHRRGEISLPTRIVDPMPAERVKEIRKSVAKSSREFERRFGVPARTLEGWEQGRKVDATGRALLSVIAHAPEAVEQAVAAERKW